MKGIFITVKLRHATILGVVSILARPLVHIALKTVHRVPVIQMVKQTVQLFKERYTET
jgi:hypothetical protein